MKYVIAKSVFYQKFAYPILCSSTCGYVQQKALKSMHCARGGTKLAPCIFCYFVSKWMTREALQNHCMCTSTRI